MLSKFTHFLLLLPLFIGASGSATAQSLPPDPMHLVGAWAMPIYIGTTQFDDRLHVRIDYKGQLHGTLTVPGAFTAEIENVELNLGGFSFEIEADEGSGPFRVTYKARWNREKTAFSGFARIQQQGEDGVVRESFLGAFVGHRNPGP